MNSNSRNQHLPDFIYAELYLWAHENNISYQQLMYEILRYGIAEKTGHKCEHPEPDRKFSRKRKQWYCRNCFTFFDLVATSKGRFEKIPRPPIWELNKPLELKDWSKMPESDNADLK